MTITAERPGTDLAAARRAMILRSLIGIGGTIDAGTRISPASVSSSTAPWALETSS